MKVVVILLERNTYQQGSMYANMFAKIGQAVSDIGAAKQKKKDATDFIKK